MHSQRMASIALSVIGCIDFLAYRTILRVRCFFRKKLDVFFPARKALDESWDHHPAAYFLREQKLFPPRKNPIEST